MSTHNLIRHAPGPILVVLSVLSALLAIGCIEREGRPVNPCTNVTIVEAIEVTNVDKVDLLFMVDNSNSMDQEQAALIAELPSLIRILTTGDFDDSDGLPLGDDPNDFEPVKDLHVGIVTSDMGTGGFMVPTCARSDFGDDGLLRTQGNVAAGCMATYPPFLGFVTGGDPDAFATQVACVAVTGTGGCGFEQQLEALLKAASPSAPTAWTAPGYTAPRFFQDTFGHADRENDGFIRAESVLALVPVTDEEDCSARDPELFNPTSATYGSTDLNLRCFAHADAALHPISRFVDGFLQLRERPGLLVYAPITGIPQDLVPDADDASDYERLVSPDPTVRDDRMEERVDPSMPTRLMTSCTNTIPERGSAFPPVRIVRVAQELENRGAGVTVQSICEDSYSGALSEIIRQIASALSTACLPRELNLEADGTVSCDVLAVLPPGMSDCAALGAEPKVEGGAPVIEEGRSVCVMPQLVPADRSPTAPAPSGVGWFYDNYTSELPETCEQRIAFTAQPPPGTTVRLECFQSVQGGGTGVSVGTFCDPDAVEMSESTAPNPCGGGSDPAMRPDSLECDPVARTCGVPCTIDSDCVDASLVGYVCDTRPLEVVDPDGFGGNTGSYNFCVNPTCG
jgi:hypothetical protein